jgi:purine nucleoside permease
MKKIFEKWYKHDDRLIQFTYYDGWDKGHYGIHTNGAKKENGDTCLDVNINFWRFNLNYVNWNLQNTPHIKLSNAILSEGKLE